jgi:uncharacterized LabA/DUF88 family protein
MQKKIIILIDGGFLRVRARHAGHNYTPHFIERFAHLCKSADEEIFRVLYYDCAPSTATVKLPVSGGPHTFTGSDQWLHTLAAIDLFAVRRGVLKFRGFKPIATPVPLTRPLTDADFKPDFEQKGVDMRIGLDIASYSAARAIDRIVLVSNDTDCVPAIKSGRKAGIQIVMIHLPNCNPAKELVAHSDFRRPVTWPQG